jgi:hypothetical protein
MLGNMLADLIDQPLDLALEKPLVVAALSERACFLPLLNELAVHVVGLIPQFFDFVTRHGEEEYTPRLCRRATLALCPGIR